MENGILFQKEKEMSYVRRRSLRAAKNRTRRLFRSHGMGHLPDALGFELIRKGRLGRDIAVRRAFERAAAYFGISI